MFFVVLIYLYSALRCKTEL